MTITFNDINSDVNFVNNDMLNSAVVNFDNFCKNTLKIWPTPQSRSDRGSCSFWFKVHNTNLLQTKCHILSYQTPVDSKFT